MDRQFAADRRLSPLSVLLLLLLLAGLILGPWHLVPWAGKQVRKQLGGLLRNDGDPEEEWCIGLGEGPGIVDGAFGIVVTLLTWVSYFIPWKWIKENFWSVVKDGKAVLDFMDKLENFVRPKLSALGLPLFTLPNLGQLQKDSKERKQQIKMREREVQKLDDAVAESQKKDHNGTMPEKLAKHHIGVNEESLARQLHDLGDLFFAEANFDEANKYYGSALKWYDIFCRDVSGNEKVPGYQERYVEVQIQLAIIQELRAQNKEGWKKALVMMQGAQKSEKDIFGDRSSKLKIEIDCGLARIYQRLENEEAVSCDEEGREYQVVMKYDEEGLKIARDGLRMCRKVGEKGALKAKAANMVGVLYVKIWKRVGKADPESVYFENALVHYELGYEIREKVLGKDHLDTLASLNNLGMLKADIKDWQGARTNFESVLEGRQKVLSEGHHLLGDVLRNEGKVLLELQERAEAKVKLQQAFQIYKSCHGKDHHNTLEVGELLSENWPPA